MDRHREINDDCARRWLAELEQLKAERARKETGRPGGLPMDEAEGSQPADAGGQTRRRRARCQSARSPLPIALPGR